ncbi:TPA: oligosaccharide flippase family protein [Acinetobacter baumannii]|nr:oligosaccharide flippase family protein [Acinetobacter baumannii]HBI9051301.1 oligosaccharide flippase family protein [Acinetobacter baumannii]HBI9053914.1 oligosaccharide flippase family protein [Acinetobacter baumannii]
MTLTILFKVAFWRGLTAILSFLTVMLCMKNLSVNDFAEYSFAFTIYTAFCLLPNIGINNYIVLEEGRDKLINKNNNIKIYFSIIVVAAFLLNYFGFLSNLLFFAVAGGVFGSIFDYYLSRFQAKKQFLKYSIMMPVRTLFFFIGVLLVFYVFNNKSVSEIFKISALIYFVFYTLFILKNLNKDFFNLKSNLSLYIGSLSFLIFELCALLMMRSEVWVLSFYSEKIGLPKSDIANYWAAFNFIMIISMLSSTLSNVVLPYIKKSQENNFSSLKGIVNKVSIIMVVLLILSSFLAYIMTIFYFNSDYSNLSVYVLVLGVGVFASFLANIERLKLMVGEKNKSVDRLVVFQVIFSIIMNLIFIYFLGIWGAIFTFIMVRVLSLVIFKKIGQQNVFTSE